MADTTISIKIDLKQFAEGLEGDDWWNLLFAMLTDPIPERCPSEILLFLEDSGHADPLVDAAVALHNQWEANRKKYDAETED